MSAPINEKQIIYDQTSIYTKKLKEELANQLASEVEVPVIIGGKKIFTKQKQKIICPHDHQHVLGHYYKASAEEILMAQNYIANNKESNWRKMSFMDRAAVFLKAAELLSEKYRFKLNAATMLGQSKTAIQAELDSACELIDFWRFNVHFMQEIYSEINLISPKGVWNRLEYRALEGFVLAITPFNFTAIAGNLPTAPALMGNSVIWKPASASMLSSYYIMEILKEAGLPDGVINMIPGDGSQISERLLSARDLAGVHFTGSTNTFNYIWKTVGNNLASNLYKTYPRLVGETGGKDYILACADADIDALTVALIKGAFEYQGQKCSAVSRAYIPKSIWNQLQDKILSNLNKLTYGNITDFSHFMGAVIDKKSFDNTVRYIEEAKKSSEAKVIYGGKYSDEVGYFISSTIILTDDPMYKTMQEEIFAPVLTIYLYSDDLMDETLEILEKTSPYALTGAIFAQDRNVVTYLTDKLVNTAGNFYINDKPTGAIVGQQPFGGARMSGTNDKAGSKLNLLRWTSPRSIKENFNPPTHLIQG